jgi:glutamate carboxypeptidase
LALVVSPPALTADRAQPAARDFLKALVEIPSGTRQRDAVDQVQTRLGHELEGLGFAVHYVANPKGAEVSGKLLEATREGAPGPAANSVKPAKYVTLLMHADTVFEPNSGFSGWQEEEKTQTARGPGVIDNKGGMVVAL